MQQTADIPRFVAIYFLFARFARFSCMARNSTQAFGSGGGGAGGSALFGGSCGGVSAGAWGGFSALSFAAAVRDCSKLNSPKGSKTKNPPKYKKFTQKPEKERRF